LLDKGKKVTNIHTLLVHTEDEYHAHCTAYLDRISVSVILFGLLKYPLKISSRKDDLDSADFGSARVSLAFGSQTALGISPLLREVR